MVNLVSLVLLAQEWVTHLKSSTDCLNNMYIATIITEHFQVSQFKQLFSVTEYCVLQQTLRNEGECSLLFACVGGVRLYNTIVASVSGLLDKQYEYYPSNDTLYWWTAQWECEWRKTDPTVLHWGLVHVRIFSSNAYAQTFLAWPFQSYYPLLTLSYLPCNVFVNKWWAESRAWSSH